MPPTLVPAGTPLVTRQEGNHRVYVNPRISANQLALFAVSAHAKQESIVRSAKRVSKVKVANYAPARAAVYRTHTEDGLSEDRILAAAERLKDLGEPGSFEAACNKLSSKGLKGLAPIVAGIDCAGTRIQRPQSGFNHVLIEGVRVSIQPEVVFSSVYRGSNKFGGVLVNFSKTEPFNFKSGKYTAGDYAAFLVFQMLALRFSAQGGPRFGSCFSVDVPRGDVYVAPSSHVTMLKNIQAACRSIVRQWNEVEDEEEPEF